MGRSRVDKPPFYSKPHSSTRSKGCVQKGKTETSHQAPPCGPRTWHLDDLHPVQQGRWDGGRGVGGRDKEDLGEVEGHVEIVVGEVMVLLRIQHLRGGRHGTVAAAPGNAHGRGSQALALLGVAGWGGPGGALSPAPSLTCPHSEETCSVSHSGRPESSQQHQGPFQPYPSTCVSNVRAASTELPPRRASSLGGRLSRRRGSRKGACAAL